MVTLSELDAVMQDASQIAGAGSSRLRADLFLGLVARLTGEERRFVVGLLRGGLRQGALESVVMTAVARAGGVTLGEARRAVAARADLADVAQALLVEGPGALDRFRLSVGRGVSPMLASSAKSVAEALAKTGPAGVEWKLDGIRAQIHKQGNDIRVLTRSLDDITDRVPEVVELIRPLRAASAIFDGELIALHPDGRPKPFQETGSRAASRIDPEVARARAPLTAYLFDVLHLDGADLIDEPSRVRRAALEEAVPPDQLTPRLQLAPRLQVANNADPEQVNAATVFADDAVARGHEGVVVKADDATYEMGRRGAGWVKVKPVHTLDLVILAVELPRHAVGPTDGYVIELRPEVVVEIALDGVQNSPRYPAGLALRFARVVRHRTDKTPGEADPIELVEALRQL